MVVSNFQSSFIPKESVTQEPFPKKKAGMLGVLAVSLLVLSIAASAGLYGYKSLLKKNISSLQAELGQAEGGIDKKSITEMSQFSKKLASAKQVVAKHQVLSNFIAELSSSTVKTVQFTSFSYDSKANELLVSLKGKADSYATVALQENVLSQNKDFKSVSFSNLKLSEKGSIDFDLNISVDPKISVYSVNSPI